jgi:deazaflavin-dependent oxidoreductase (nitroreductase family)
MSKRALLERLARLFAQAHIAVYRATGGRIGGRFQGGRMLLLTTRGRKSGLQRTTPLFFLRDGDDLVVVASNRGLDWAPAWWLNLQANPDGQVQVGPRIMQVRAAKADPADRARLWPLLNQMYAGYEGYQRQVSHEIPVVRLHPARQP